MPRLNIRQKRGKLTPSLPHIIKINGTDVGMMKGDEINIEIPEGNYWIQIKSVVPFFSATKAIKIEKNVKNVLEFSNKEQIWDIIFTIDMIFWIAEFFFKLPDPWNLVYKIVTNGYFIIWLIYEYFIREKYFKIVTYTAVENDNSNVLSEN